MMNTINTFLTQIIVNAFGERRDAACLFHSTTYLWDAKV